MLYSRTALSLCVTFGTVLLGSARADEVALLHDVLKLSQESANVAIGDDREATRDRSLVTQFVVTAALQTFKDENLNATASLAAISDPRLREAALQQVAFHQSKFRRFELALN